MAITVEAFLRRLAQRVNETGLQHESITVSGAEFAAITDAETSHDLNAVFSDTEVEAALDALGEKINEVIAALSS